MLGFIIYKRNSKFNYLADHRETRVVIQCCLELSKAVS